MWLNLFDVILGFLGKGIGNLFQNPPKFAIVEVQKWWAVSRVHQVASIVKARENTFAHILEEQTFDGKVV